MTDVTMFSVPLIHYEIANWHIAKQKIKEALPNIQESMLESNGQVYTDFFDEELKYKLPDWSDVVIDIITPYLQDFTGKTRVEFTDMWFQTALKGMSHGCHNHGASGWSSVIYLDYDDKIHSPTKFYSPFNNPWNGKLEDYLPPVKEGDMVIFPAHITHEAEDNTSDVPRTIISYNLRGKTDIVKRTLWDDEGDPKIIVREYREDC